MNTSKLLSDITKLRIQHDTLQVIVDRAYDALAAAGIKGGGLAEGIVALAARKEKATTEPQSPKED